MATMSACLSCVFCGPFRWFRRWREGRALRHMTLHSAPRFTPPISRGKVVDVFDGDTLTIVAFIEGRPYRFRCRLPRIDAPEMRPDPHHTAKQKQAEVRAARLSRNYLSDLCLHRMVRVTDIKNEKWGRVMGELTVEGDDVTLSDHMLRAGMALAYSGGTKSAWDWTRFPVRQRNAVRRAPRGAARGARVNVRNPVAAA